MLVEAADKRGRVARGAILPRAESRTAAPATDAAGAALSGHGGAHGAGDVVGALASASWYLAVNSTGVGRPVVDLLRERQLPCRLWPAVITSGHGEGMRSGTTR